jgi:DNA-binding CsgD family transcriptional regulator
MSEHFERLTAEHERDGIGPEIMESIRNAIRAVATHRPPSRVVGRAVDGWTRDLIEEVAMDFAEFLLGGRLSEAFALAWDEGHLRAILRRNAQQFISNRMRKGEIENIMRRAHDTLERDPAFVVEGTGQLRRWTLLGRPTELWEPTDEDLRRLAWGLPIPPSYVRFRRNTRITPRVVSNDDLRELLENILQVAKGGLTSRSIRVILTHRLGLRDVETLSISRHFVHGPKLEDLLGEGADGFEDAEARIIGSDLIRGLTVRQLRILGLRLVEGRTRDEVAEELQIAHGTVDNELARVGRLVLDACGEDHALARAVLRNVATLRHSWPT